MAENVALQKHTRIVGELLIGQLDCQGMLRSGVTITSITSISASGLTITEGQVNAGVLSINGKDVAIGKAITFKVTGAAAGTYAIRAVCVLSSGETGVVFEMPYVLVA